METRKRISSKRLEELFASKRNGTFSPSENEELAIYAKNFANIVLKTPSMRRFLLINDPYDHLDLESEMRAQVVITILGTCPWTFDPSVGSKAYSYCLACAHNACCEVQRDYKRRIKIGKTFTRIAELWKGDFFGHRKKSTCNKT